MKSAHALLNYFNLWPTGNCGNCHCAEQMTWSRCHCGLGLGFGLGCGLSPRFGPRPGLASFPSIRLLFRWRTLCNDRRSGSGCNKCCNFAMQIPRRRCIRNENVWPKHTPSGNCHDDDGRDEDDNDATIPFATGELLRPPSRKMFPTPPGSQRILRPLLHRFSGVFEYANLLVKMSHRFLRREGGNERCTNPMARLPQFWEAAERYATLLFLWWQPIFNQRPGWKISHAIKNCCTLKNMF